MITMQVTHSISGENDLYHIRNYKLNGVPGYSVTIAGLSLYLSECANENRLAFIHTYDTPGRSGKMLAFGSDTVRNSTFVFSTG